MRHFFIAGSMIAVALTALTALTGCDAARNDTPEDDMSPVFVAFGGRRLTAVSVSNSVMILARIREMSTKKALAPTQFPYWANSTAMKMIPALLAAERMDLMLISNGVTRTTRSDDVVLHRYNRIVKANCVSVEDLMKRFGSLAPAFAHQFSRESRMEAFFGSNPKFKVTERDRQQYHLMHSNAVECAEQFNAAAFARATNVCMRLRAGEPWGKVAPEVTDEGKDEADAASARNWEFWEAMHLKHASEPEVAQAVSGLKEGEWTPPIETGEGIVIARYLGEEPETKARKCARILIQLAIPPLELKGTDLETHLLRRKREQYQFSIREDLVTDYPAHYPMGTNFSYKIWFEPRKLKRGFNRL